METTRTPEETEALAAALAEHLEMSIRTRVHERTRRDGGRRIEGQPEHSSISTAPPPSACLKRTAKRGAGSTPSPASGHSTNAIASSKYGSRSPHSAAETPAKR
jgi:hypothetical protein